MRINLKTSDYRNKDEFVRATLSKARELALDAWGNANRLHKRKLINEVNGLSRQELARKLVTLMARPVRRRAAIDDVMRRQAERMRTKGKPVKEIALELGISIPSVYNITR